LGACANETQTHRYEARAQDPQERPHKACQTGRRLCCARRRRREGRAHPGCKSWVGAAWEEAPFGWRSNWSPTRRPH